MEIPEDRYILWEAEDQGLELPFSCRNGCCTACAVKVKSGEIYQYQALGVSRELREEGYALMCVSLPLSELELETVPEVRQRDALSPVGSPSTRHHVVQSYAHIIWNYASHSTVVLEREMQMHRSLCGGVGLAHLPVFFASPT